MKKLLLASFCVFLFFSLQAQLEVNGIDIGGEEINFCEIIAMEFNTYKKKMVVTDENFSGKVVETTYTLLKKETRIGIDIGEAIDWNASQDFKDLNGNPVIFESIIAALNLLTNNGWEFIESYTNTFDNVAVKHFLLKKTPK